LTITIVIAEDTPDADRIEATSKASMNGLGGLPPIAQGALAGTLFPSGLLARHFCPDGP
jgi:hypothetical protein